MKLIVFKKSYFRTRVSLTLKLLFNNLVEIEVCVMHRFKIHTIIREKNFIYFVSTAVVYILFRYETILRIFKHCT